MVSLIHLGTTYEVVDLVKFVYNLTNEQETRLLAIVAGLNEEDGIILVKKNEQTRFASLEDFGKTNYPSTEYISIQKMVEGYSILMRK